jgi:hypothetical protein
MIKFENITINGEEVEISIEENKENLSIAFDIWNNNWGFNDPIVNKLTSRWHELLENPKGKPTKSRASVGMSNKFSLFCLGFGCLSTEDVEDLKDLFRELISDEKNFLDLESIRKERKAADEARKQERIKQLEEAKKEAEKINKEAGKAECEECKLTTK